MGVDAGSDAESWLKARGGSDSEHTGYDAYSISRIFVPAGADTVACYVADLARVTKPATIDARLAAISAAHRAAGHNSPTKAEAVRLVRRGVRRTLGTAQR